MAKRSPFAVSLLTLVMGAPTFAAPPTSKSDDADLRLTGFQEGAQNQADDLREVPKEGAFLEAFEQDKSLRAAALQAEIQNGIKNARSRMETEASSE